jgi:hypothetical protein
LIISKDNDGNIIGCKPAQSHTEPEITNHTQGPVAPQVPDAIAPFLWVADDRQFPKPGDRMTLVSARCLEEARWPDLTPEESQDKNLTP